MPTVTLCHVTPLQIQLSNWNAARNGIVRRRRWRQCRFRHEISTSGKVTTVMASSVSWVFSFSLMLALHSNPEGNKWISINHAHRSFSRSCCIRDMKEVRIRKRWPFHLWLRPYSQELQEKWNQFCTILLIKSPMKYVCHKGLHLTVDQTGSWYICK